MNTHTSVSHPLRIDWLDIDAPGRLGMTMAPGKKKMSVGDPSFAWDRDLPTDIDALVAAGATVLVTLVEEHELEQVGIPDLFARVEASGIEGIHFPIRDVDVPRDDAAVHDLVERIDEYLFQGEYVVIHCMGGLGRTGTLAGCCLRERGIAGPEALAELKKARRSDRCPETHGQRAYVLAYEPRPVFPDGSWYATSARPVEGLNRIVRRVAWGGSRREAVRDRIASVERAVQASPSTAFSFDEAGCATLVSEEGTFAAGHFSTPSIGALRERIAQSSRDVTGKVRLSILHGGHALTDIGTLQATAPPGTLFQVASQFNCLEAPSERIVPVHQYTGDYTQGPRASVSAFPATLLRHYQAPAADGSRYVQTDERCINLLGDVFDSDVAEVYSGYLEAQHVHDPEALAVALEERFEHVRVGVHDDVEVVYGYDWGGPVPSGQRIAQVFTSTIALGYSQGGGTPEFARIRRQLLRAAYLGTLLAAIELGKHAVVLTLIGGGVFRNPHRDIWDAIHWALSEADALAGEALHVVVNTRERLEEEDADEARARGGDVIAFR